jgi:hypothetical protein
VGVVLIQESIDECIDAGLGRTVVGHGRER